MSGFQSLATKTADVRSEQLVAKHWSTKSPHNLLMLVSRGIIYLESLWNKACRSGTSNTLEARISKALYCLSRKGKLQAIYGFIIERHSMKIHSGKLNEFNASQIEIKYDSKILFFGTFTIKNICLQLDINSQFFIFCWSLLSTRYLKLARWSIAVPIK